MLAALTNPATIATVYPALLMLAVAYPLRPQGGRRTGFARPAPRGWNPLTARQRAAVRRLAHLRIEDRKPFVNRAGLLPAPNTGAHQQ